MPWVVLIGQMASSLRQCRGFSRLITSRSRSLKMFAAAQLLAPKVSGVRSVDEIGKPALVVNYLRKRWICMFARNGTSGCAPIFTMPGTSSVIRASRCSLDSLNLSA